MIYFFYAYLTGSMLSIIWVSIILFVLLDKNDLNYKADDQQITYILIPLFWPLVLLTQPGFFLKGREIFRIDEDSFADIMPRHKRRLKQLELMAETPPLCGSVVLYRHSYIYDENDQSNEILFKSEDIATHFKGKDLPLPNYEENLAIIAWIKNLSKIH